MTGVASPWRLLIAAVVAVTLVPPPATAAPLELPWTHISTEHPSIPLPSASVQAVHQDRLGFIWLGFYSAGLARYDGHSLDVFDIPDGLLDSTVRELVEDGEGYLWVGSETGVVVSDEPLHRYLPHERPRFRRRLGTVGLVQGRVRLNWMAPGPEGSVLVATASQEVVRYRTDADGAVTATSLTPQDRRRHSGRPMALLARRDGTVWLALDQPSILTAAPGATSLVDSGLGADLPAPIQTFYESPAGTLWCGGRDGTVYRLDESGPSPRLVAVSRALTDTILAMLVTGNGELWVGSVGAGVLRITEEGAGTAEVPTRRNGLPSETVWDLIEDREGNLWVAHNAGLSRLRADYRAFGHYTASPWGGEAPTLPEPAVFAVLPPPADDPAPRLWVGTGGGLTTVGPTISTAIDVTDGLTSSAIYTLARDRMGRIWVGTNAGLNVLSFAAPPPPPMAGHRRGRIRTADWSSPSDGYALGTIYACRELTMAASEGAADRVTAMWVAGTHGLAGLVEGRWFLFAAASGLPPAGTFVVEATPDGRLWVATRDSGVLASREPLTPGRLDELLLASRGAPREITEEVLEPAWNRLNGAPSDSVHNLIWVGERLWAGTAFGLATIQGWPARTGLVLDRSSGLGGDRVMGLAVSPRTGSLWVTQNDGLAEIDPDDGTVVRLVSKQDGLIDNEVWQPDALAIDGHGTVFLGTPKGLSLFRPDLTRGNQVPPLLALRSVELDQDGSGFNEVTVEYAALTFANEQRVRYRTRLVGYRDQWSAPTTETTFRFTNLPAVLIPRTYTFEVEACNDAGVWSERPVALDLVIRPATWQSWWAVLLYVLVLAAGGVVISHARTVHLTRRTRELEQQVALRTTEIGRRAQELETLDQIVESINREVELERVMEALLEQGLVLVPQADRAVFLLAEEDGRHFRVAAASGWRSERVVGITFTADEARQRYVEEAIEVADGIRLVAGLAARAGASRVRHLEVSDNLLTVDLHIGHGLEAFLVFDLVPLDPSRMTFEARTLQRYRQHAISALDKARVVHELEEKSREAAEASTAKSRFLAAMSHELRTPLNAIIGFSEILVSRLGTTIEPRLAKFQTNILTSGRHLLALINDILDLSKVEAGRMELDLGPVDLGELAHGVARVMVGVAARRNVTVVVESTEGLPTIVADGPKVKQILYNLVSNAVKFSPDDSPVTVTLSPRPAADSPLAVDSVAMAVSDLGAGIPEEDQELVFEEFRQLDAPTPDTVGTGLGLPLVRRLVELHGGRVDLTSAAGRGSTFTALLPVDASAVVEPSSIAGDELS